jgi:uncharacterized Tic20 family protein
MVNNSININKTKESLSSDGHQFHQYQQTKQSLNFKLSFVLLLLVELLTITV